MPKFAFRRLQSCFAGGSADDLPTSFAGFCVAGVSSVVGFRQQWFFLSGPARFSRQAGGSTLKWILKRLLCFRVFSFCRVLPVPEDLRTCLRF